MEARFYIPFLYSTPHIDRRVSAFYSSASISSAFSGLLAYGIININGVGGRPGWAWIFILEGLFTFIFGVVSFFILPRSPTHARFLNKMEMAYIDAKLKKDGSTGNPEADRFSWREVRQGLALPHVWMASVIFFFIGEPCFFMFLAGKYH